MFLRAKRSCGYVKQHNETRGLDYRADVRRYLFVMFTSSFMLRRIKRLRASNLFTASPESRSVNRLAKRNEIRIMILRKICILLSLFASLLVAASCNRSVVTGSKLTPTNYDQITTGMTKAQVERILGPPTTVEMKDMMIFKKTTYRYEDGKKFAMFTFKNDELDSKEGNLQREP